MFPYRTVLLRHAGDQGVHYDWLLVDPGDPDGRLWTARCAVDSRSWATVGWWLLEPIGAHRRVYLTYEGPLSGGRGTVQRVDSGTFRPILWTCSRIVIDLALRHAAGRVEMDRLEPHCWRARLVAC